MKRIKVSNDVPDEDISRECIAVAIQAVKLKGVHKAMYWVRHLGPLTLERIRMNPGVTMHTIKCFHSENTKFENRELRAFQSRVIPLLSVTGQGANRYIGETPVNGPVTHNAGVALFYPPREDKRVAVDRFTGRRLPHSRVLFQHGKWIGLIDERVRLNVFDTELNTYILPEPFKSNNVHKYMINTEGSPQVLRFWGLNPVWVQVDDYRLIKIEIVGGKDIIRLRKKSTHGRWDEYKFTIKGFEKVDCFSWEDHHIRYWTYKSGNAYEMSCNLRELEEYKVRLALRDARVPVDDPKMPKVFTNFPTELYPRIVSYLTGL
jgi:hypothetical protein